MEIREEQTRTARTEGSEMGREGHTEGEEEERGIVEAKIHCPIIIEWTIDKYIYRKIQH